MCSFPDTHFHFIEAETGTPPPGGLATSPGQPLATLPPQLLAPFRVGSLSAPSFASRLPRFNSWSSTNVPLMVLMVLAAVCEAAQHSIV